MSPMEKPVQEPDQKESQYDIEEWGDDRLVSYWGEEEWIMWDEDAAVDLDNCR